MSELFDINANLQLLGTLRQTAEKFAKREEQVTRDLHARKYKVNKATQEAQEGADAELTAQMEQAQELYIAEVARLKALYQKRRSRIEKGRLFRLKNLPARSQEVRGRWLGELQMQNITAKKGLTEELSSANADFVEISASLGDHVKKLRALEKKTQSAIFGCGTYRWRLKKRIAGWLRPDMTLRQHVELLEKDLTTAEKNFFEFQEYSLPRFFSYLPVPLILLLLCGMVGIIGLQVGFHSSGILIAGASAGFAFLVAVVIHTHGLNQSKVPGRALVGALAEARAILRALDQSLPAISMERAPERERIMLAHQLQTEEIERQWGRAQNVVTEFEEKVRRKMDKQIARVSERITRVQQARLEQLDAQRLGWVEHLQAQAEQTKQQALEGLSTEIETLASDETNRWNEIEQAWNQEIYPIYQALQDRNFTPTAQFPDWDKDYIEKWTPPYEFTEATRFGVLGMDLASNPNGIPKSPRLPLPGPTHVGLPAELIFPKQGSILFETNESGGSVIPYINNVILRLFATMPPGKLSFTLIDPVALGENFAGFMHLADYEESLINRRIWTQRDQIEERLGEMGEHIEKVIQMYLRNEYPTITEYNRQAGSVAEKYHFMVVSDFPAAFSDVAVKRLQSIAMSGPRCGIFTLIHWNQRQPSPDGFIAEQLRQNSICIQKVGHDFVLNKQQTDLGVGFYLDEPPHADIAVELVHKIGKSSIDSNRIQVAFTQVAPKPNERWHGDTTSELRVAVGRTGATKLQYLAIGKGTRQHALFAGKTGSGKSTLFHVIITNLALTCSPEQVEFYLIDFKKGVEFKCYAAKQLPHARVVAIESDREFALSVLQKVDAELRRRGDIFRKLGVQDLAGYRRTGAQEPMPRSILLIDEFQEFFVDDDSVAQSASLLFDRIVRQGRAFGIHVLLGSQTLGGAYSLARTTLGQMVIRVALQCNEADAYLIMDENNPAPRLLTRPGEGIYNDAAGAIEGNSPFQVVWLPDDERDTILDDIHKMAVQSGKPISKPIVFEGNIPSDVRENPLLAAVLETQAVTAPEIGRCWLGSPNSIKGPTEAAFQRQNGNHLLIVGQREEAAMTMLGLSLLALTTQYPAGTAKFVVLHTGSQGGFIDEVLATLQHDVVIVRGQDLAGPINDLSTELKARSSGEVAPETAPTTFLIINGLQKYKKLRQEDDFSFSSSDEVSSAAQFNELVSEGSSNGIHIITTMDTLNSVNRYLNRKALSEFSMRVVFQMSANDSASLIDSPNASNLGLHRAIYFNEQEGQLETFRPYATPDRGWVEQVLKV